MIVDKTIHVAHVGAFGNAGPWLHFNLVDVCPPGHDLRAILKEPDGRGGRLAAWSTAMRGWDKGLLWQIAERKRLLGDRPIVGASMEAEEIVPVPHDRRMVGEGDSIRNYGLSLRRVLWHISDVVGLPVVPYGASQVGNAHVSSAFLEHRLQTLQWYIWHKPGGPLRGGTPCQSFYLHSGVRPAAVMAWVYGALDRHATVTHGTRTKPLTVFVSPEAQGGQGAGESDDFETPNSFVLGGVLAAIDDHPLECRVVSWFKASTSARAEKATRILTEAASLSELIVSA